MSGSYFNNLANVRGLAAVVVLMSHVVQIHFLRFIGLGTPLHQVSSVSSEYAVVVFFILSGYLITHTLEANIKQNGRLRLSVFLTARIARLYPPFLYAIAVSLTVFIVMDVFGLPGRHGPLSLPGDLYAAREIIDLPLGEIKQALLMLQGMLEINGPLWSLYMEAKLYILFACVMAIATGRRSLVQMLILVGMFYSVAKAGVELNPGFAGYAVVWLTGALAYYVWNEHGNWSNRMLLCGGLILFIVLAEGYLAQQNGASPWITARSVLIATIIAWLLFKLRINVPASGCLANFSYSLYATHFPVLLLAQSLLIATGNPSIGTAIAVAALSTGAAVGVALLGGVVEAKKSVVQNRLLALAERVCHFRVRAS